MYRQIVIPHLIRALALVAVVGLVSAQAEEKQERLRALLITGGCCHNYKFQSKALIEGVAKEAKVEWKVRNEGGTGTKA